MSVRQYEDRAVEVADAATARSDRTSGRPDWRRAVEVAGCATARPDPATVRTTPWQTAALATGG
jgi:hypothetical protein